VVPAGTKIGAIKVLSTAWYKCTFPDGASSARRSLLSTSCTPSCVKLTACWVSPCRRSPIWRMSSAAREVRAGQAADLVHHHGEATPDSIVNRA